MSYNNNEILDPKCDLVCQICDKISAVDFSDTEISVLPLISFNL